jgi:hypothetical protein
MLPKNPEPPVIKKFKIQNGKIKMHINTISFFSDKSFYMRLSLKA